MSENTQSTTIPLIIGLFIGGIAGLSTGVVLVQPTVQCTHGEVLASDYLSSTAHIISGDAVQVRMYRNQQLVETEWRDNTLTFKPGDKMTFDHIVEVHCNTYKPNNVELHFKEP